METFNFSIILVGILLGFIISLAISLISGWKIYKTENKVVRFLLFYLLTAAICFVLILILAFVRYQQIELTSVILAFGASLFWPLAFAFSLLAMLSQIGNPFGLF